MLIVNREVAGTQHVYAHNSGNRNTEISLQKTQVLYYYSKRIRSQTTDLDARQSTRVAFSPEYDLWQGHFSLDGRWIVFRATRPNRVEATIFATAVSGGPWIPVTDGKQWDDKPRWSPNGKMIYFVSQRNGFYNVFGISFDTAKGEPVGSAFSGNQIQQSECDDSQTDHGSRARYHPRQSRN